MTNFKFINRCISDTLTGLRDGLSLFSGPSRSAIIFSIKKNEELYICDPQNLLRGYEPKLKAIYLNSDNWCSQFDPDSSNISYNRIEPQDNLQLDGLISNGGSSYPVYYQMWFTDHHPNLCSLCPTECWLEHAVLRLSHDIANESNLYTGISGSFLREYATHAVHDCLVDMSGMFLGLDVQIQIYPMLEAILGISKTNEEGARPFGTLCYVEPRLLDRIDFLTKFRGTDKPLLTNFKHVRKLLQAVEHSHRSLIADGKNIVGIAGKKPDFFHIAADFQGKLGFISANEETICSFQDGSYSSNTHRAKLFEVEEALLDFNIDPEVRNDIFKIVASLVHNAEDRMFGCSIVIDLSPEPIDISGQALAPSIDLRDLDKLQLAGALAKVDGGLHIRADLHLHSFACLLDGFRVKNENRARGARYNSALRFTAQHPETIVVVVSSDRPVSVFQQGHEVVSGYSEDGYLQCNLYPLPLKDWLQEAD
ncbi:DNA integrity scanning protein DisA nucleotide-binding domain protein [Desulforhopalus singaporensis]|uniref:DisA checkpoint controller nucleotide-binding n=1 Tax=Desulforhopalus singaporensis TaxID=91360 RepID=A0A1H0QMG6_9BACT|nr:DNA integrity scanning protein DisA nucleotide-binding domain protein [Desulforhopalus singaporensis]SDP18563.1 DisA checkpoint controller nucleotide-binding [Desulforhopalus singaporensis]